MTMIMPSASGASPQPSSQDDDLLDSWLEMSFPASDPLPGPGTICHLEPATPAPGGTPSDRGGTS